MESIRWPNKSAMGASYCLDQSPGGERYGGLMVTLRWPEAEAGRITIQPNDRRTGQPLDERVVDPIRVAAEAGIREAARAVGADLDGVDIVLSDFAYHPVDSPTWLYGRAAKSAFRSAWEAWQRFPPAAAEQQRPA